MATSQEERNALIQTIESITKLPVPQPVAERVVRVYESTQGSTTHRSRKAVQAALPDPRMMIVDRESGATETERLMIELDRTLDKLNKPGSDDSE